MRLYYYNQNDNIAMATNEKYDLPFLLYFGRFDRCKRIGDIILLSLSREGDPHLISTMLLRSCSATWLLFPVTMTMCTCHGGKARR